jgi:hypothetical protein
MSEGVGVGGGEASNVVISPEATRAKYDPRLVSRAVAADVVSVLVFALIGRASHDEGLTASGLVVTAWPFVVGVAGGWAGIFLARLSPLSYPAAAMMLVKTVVLGCAIRVIATDGGSPVSFVLVATIFLATAFFGWRAGVRALSARQGSPTPVGS